MGLFGGIKDAKYSEGGVYVVPGLFRFKIKEVKIIETRAKDKGFVAEFEVLKSSAADRQPEHQQGGRTVQAAQVGLPRLVAVMAVSFYYFTTIMD